MKIKDNLRENLPYMLAPFWKRFLCSFCDIFLVVIINIPMYLVISKATGGTIDEDPATFSNLTTKPYTMLVFSMYMLFCYTVFFILMPIFYEPQTIFSSCFGIKAITLDGSKPTMVNWFKSFFVVVFIVLFANIFLFSMLCSIDSQIKDINLFDHNQGPYDSYWKLPIKIMFIAVVFIQIHYFCTVSLSKKPINWFTEFSNLVYVDINKEKLFAEKDASKDLSTEQYEEEILDEEEFMEEDEDIDMLDEESHEEDDLEDEEIDEEYDSEVEEEQDVDDENLESSEEEALSEEVDQEVD